MVHFVRELELLPIILKIIRIVIWENSAHCTARVLLDFIITMLISTVFAYIIPNKRFVRKYVFHIPMIASQEVK